MKCSPPAMSVKEAMREDAPLLHDDLYTNSMGEVPIVPPLPAVASAVSHAIGVRMQTLPLSPGDILEALG